ncbi:beta-1,6-N-acetylglucosaminyltransferase [Mastigocoleus sp. MO_188.B34]|uniref:beta-1,6-N-acetylglucosaminyltransferase n=1 Tax=Mastigocoleus sp. MO_188.B34 TaxID=3036635 RepID=UPI002624F4C6|nr:beta-1,6-N-acetylglucosaminyltransferase [Mastigocoleus sp. MO_188.B34]MDJ0696982.1 beta-1,6-N-acetylglucosaminyltransferase [Mastigocoleus sp. MO_188.B34]
MKFFYFIRIHETNEQTYRLIEYIKKSNTSNEIILSYDSSSSDLDVESLKYSCSKVIDIEGRRGTFLLIESYLKAMKWLIDNRVSYDWLINLSGQDYPVKPISEIESFLSETNYDAFIEYFKVFSSESHWSIQEGESRYLFKYQAFDMLNKYPNWIKKLLLPTKLINYVQPGIRINLAYEMLGLRNLSLFQKIFNDDFICYGGSFFMTLSRRCVEYLHDFCQNHPEVIEYYKRVCLPDESLIQTILVNSKKFNLCNDNKRYIDFSQTSNGRPKILTINDYESIMQSDAHFARKFDMCEDSSILGVLDQKFTKFVGNSEFL